MCLFDLYMKRSRKPHRVTVATSPQGLILVQCAAAGQDGVVSRKQPVVYDRMELLQQGARSTSDMFLMRFIRNFLNEVEPTT